MSDSDQSNQPSEPSSDSTVGPTDNRDANTPQPASQASSLNSSKTSSQAVDPVDVENTIVSAGQPVDPERAYDGLRPRDLGAALVGHHLGSVVLEEFIGGGGMGAVFLGRDLALQRSVAVKVLATHQNLAIDTEKRFEVEAQSGAQLDHPNIARIHYSGEEKGLRYIVFEYIKGMNLRDLVARDGPQPVGDVVRYGVQLADALVHAWSRQIVHRDIKPSNIIVTRDGNAKLVDMGLARYKREDQQHDLTSSGATLGTFDYVSPEQALDPRSADIRSDIYSLGCTLYFLLTGQPPFPGGTALQKLLQHQAEQPMGVRELRPEVPKYLDVVIEKMLAKRPVARQQEPTEVLAALSSVAQKMGVVTGASTVVTVPNLEEADSSASIRQHLPWISAVALLLAIGVVLPWFWQDNSPPRDFEELRTKPVAAQAEQADESPIEEPSFAD